MTASSAALSRPQIAGAVMGIALEVYDFTTYAYFATAIGQAFFPGSTPYESLMLSLGTFGAGFLSRPVGALVIGAFADRVGRRPALVLSFVLMGVGVLASALTPGYAQIGVVAPAIVLVGRMVQGFAFGGELGATTTLLLEAAPPGRRGFYSAFQLAGQGAAAVAAGLMGIALSMTLSRGELDAYGWRIAFLVGALVLPVGFAMRRTLPETLQHETPSMVRGPVPASRTTAAVLLLGLFIVSSGAIGNYVFHYMTTYARVVLQMPATISLAVPAITGLGVVVFSLLSGKLSDRFGRKPIMVFAGVLALLAVYPAFYLILHRPSVVTLWGGLALLSGLGAMGGAAAMTAIAEALPRRVRSTGLAVVYALAVAVFGGSTQVVITWMMHVTGNPMAPAWYIMATGAVGLVARVLMPETAFRESPRPSAKARGQAFVATQ